jgi:signal transduction histidine kinase
MTLVPPPLSEREQTDESLRIEREQADHALVDLTAVDETADDVINRARERADALLNSARAKSDQAALHDARQKPRESLARARALEDHVIEDERATADEVLRDERAEHIALLSHERDETDKDLSHERARSDHALARRDDFMGLVSHDLRNMLNAMVGAATLIEKAVSSEHHVEQVITHARRIERSGARMHRLIGDLVDVASIEAGMLMVTREIGDLTQVVNEAVDVFQVQASGSGVVLVAEIVGPLPPTAFDSARILQVLGNLLSNAIKFSAHGTVVVRVEPLERDIRFSVRDTGAGVPADKLEAVFERFVQLTSGDRRGVGLGLYISKCIVEGHGGRIWAKNNGGEGSTFFFTLPII